MSWIITGSEKNPVDPFRSNVSLLLHGDGANGSTTIVDSSSSPKTVTAFGDAQISTAQSKFGGASIAFDGTGDFLSISDSSAFDLGLSNEPFTVEFWFYRNSTGNHAFFCRGGGDAGWNSTAGHQYLSFIQSGTLYWMWNSSGAAAFAFISTSTLPATQQWHHYAACYDGTTTRLFINGTLVGTQSNDGYAKPVSSNLTRVGENAAGQTRLNGHIDDLRITKGVARYTANFTPPTAPFPDA